MIDHILGRPSLQFRKIQVLAVLIFWTSYMAKGNPHGPPIAPIRKISGFFTKRLTAFQTMTITLLYLYVARNFAKLLNLESPEPLAGIYTRSYFRTTWVMTALDAGFWTAMRIRRKWLRDLCSILFSVYYLIAAERAEEKVRRVRATLTVEHLRVAWNKSTSPYLKLITRLLNPAPNHFAPRPLRIQRPPESVYKIPVDAWLYFEGTRDQLRTCTTLALDIPGGGFVAMTPRHHEDKLLTWARLCPGVPVVSLDYKKAPEYPYPYALNECYDVYHAIITTRGRCVGLSGETTPRVCVTGDSAGGNYAAGLALMVLNATSTSRSGLGWRELPPPTGLILIYPSLDLNMSSWMSEEQMQLIRQRDTIATNRNVVRKKSEYYEHTSARTPTTSAANLRRSYSDDSDADSESDGDDTATPKVAAVASTATLRAGAGTGVASPTIDIPQTQLAVSSRLSYFNDRILTPEMMRAMVILYIGPSARPDFTSDFLLSPVVAPESLLARFPPTYFLTGERDPLVDDTVIFAGRIRAAKRAVRLHRRELGLETGSDEDAVTVSLIQGISHGFLMMASLFPQANREMERCAEWIREVLEEREVPVTPDPNGYLTACTSDDERPIEIGGGLGRKRGGVNGSTKEAGRGRARGRGRAKRRGSVVSLASDDDLVDRRMRGLTARLAGGENEEYDSAP